MNVRTSEEGNTMMIMTTKNAISMEAITINIIAGIADGIITMVDITEAVSFCIGIIVIIYHTFLLILAGMETAFVMDKGVMGADKAG